MTPLFKRAAAANRFRSNWDGRWGGHPDGQADRGGGCVLTQLRAAPATSGPVVGAESCRRTMMTARL